ncbi:MAG: preprotein translocase subunit SecE [Gammaproteobacteria bacterium]|nr:MAG: preprotein translocase subunit SecE [Gammaproteobacteria bacterium]
MSNIKATNTNNNEVAGNPFDLVLQVVAVLVLVASIIGYYYLGDNAAAVSSDGGEVQGAGSGLVRVLLVLGAVFVSFGLIYMTEKGKSLWRFFGESRNEVRKVVWPTKQETIQTTVIVMVMTIALGIFIALVDAFFGWGFEKITGLGG